MWRATDAEGDEWIAGLALRFMILTACRVKEATMLPWSEMDLATKTWTLPAARNKGGRERVIPLSSEALAVVKRARAIGEGEHVFGAHANARMRAVTSAYLRWDYAEKVRDALDRLGVWVADVVAQERRSLAATW